MKAFATSLAALCATASVHAARVQLGSVRQSPPSAVVPNRYIVTLASPGGLRREAPHAAVYESLRRRDVAFTVEKEYDTADIFIGAAVTLSNGNGLEALASTPGVTSVRPVQMIKRPDPINVRVLATGAAAPNDTFSTHVITGVDKLHAEGRFGAGVKVGIIDTGTDYTHPSLGGGFGPGFKVAGGYDFVGDNFNGGNTPVPDSDPLDQCAGHGTHVAGIVGANPNNEFNVSGVAYKSSIYSYRIFGCTGGVPDDIIVDALLKGYNDGMDVLTLSLGGADGWTESASSTVASRIAQAGRIVTIAAGNDGAYGSWYTSSPGNGIDVISAASLDNTVIAVQRADVHNATLSAIVYDSVFPVPINGTLPLYATSLDTTVADDACSALPASTPDLSGSVVLIRRGTCAFTTKLANAAAKGAQYFLIYNNVAGLSAISVGNYTAVLISSTDGESLVNDLAAGKQVTISFPQTGGSENYPDPNGGLISDFTSYGPTFDMYFKPAVAAPGGNILSTYIVKEGAWAVLSGTSMATPFLAGVSALLFEAKGKTPATGRGARTLFESTAQPVAATHAEGSLLQTLTQSGAGLIDAYHALHTSIVLSTAEFLLNDTANFKSAQTFKITNTGKTSQKFTLSHEPAGTALTIDGLFANDGPVPLVANAASVKFSATTFSVAPGQTQGLTVHFTPPTGLDATTFPAYSGHIVLTSTTETLRISYLGVAASLKDKQVLDTSDTYFGIPLPAVLNATGDAQAAPTNYTFAGGDYPTLLFRLAFGTPRFLVDLVSKDTNVTASGTFASVKTLGAVEEYDYIPRNADSADAGEGYSSIDFTTPTFANGTAFPKGQFRFLVRALRVTGSPKKEADYESWLSPIVGVV